MPGPKLLSGFLLLACLIPTAAAPKPNILFLLTDDQSYEAVRSAGRLKIETPNIDRLAGRGMMFTHAYNMGAWTGAVCVSSRAMLHTGRTLWSAGGVEKKLDEEREAGRMWAPLLGNAGYETYFTGKWHLATDPEKVFDHCENVFPGMPGTVETSYNRPVEGTPDPWRADDPSLGGFWKGGTHWSVVTADTAISQLRRAAVSSGPFFICAAFNAPHDPRQAPADFLALHPLEKVDVPPSFLPRYPHAGAMEASPSLRDERLAPFPRTEFAVRTHRREYMAAVSHLDSQIGRVLDALGESAARDNTWVFLTSDHGLSCGHHGLMGKQNPYDVSIRVPFLVAGPGVPAGEISRAPVYLQDVMPTTLELAGVGIPEHVGFRSILPHIRSGADAEQRDSIFYGYRNSQRAIVHDGWKLVLYPNARIIRLYQLGTDPDETKDLAWNRLYAGRVRSLFGRLVAQQREFGDPLDLSAAYPELRHR